VKVFVFTGKVKDLRRYLREWSKKNTLRERVQ